jgi:hypothetical protein
MQRSDARPGTGLLLLSGANDGHDAGYAPLVMDLEEGKEGQKWFFVLFRFFLPFIKPNIVTRKSSNHQVWRPKEIRKRNGKKHPLF